MDKGKGKLLEDQESDQEFNPKEENVFESEQEEESEQDEEYDSEEEDEEEEDDEDELQDLIQEAQEYGDGGDMVDGLRSGKYRQKLGDTSLNIVSPKGTSFSTGSSGTTGRMRSASSPGKIFIFAPAADSLPVVPQITPEQAERAEQADNVDGSVESFAKGIDRLNIEYKKLLLSEFAGIRNQIIAHQKLVNSCGLKFMTERVNENQLELVKTQDELRIIKQDNGKRLALLEASWTYFDNKRLRGDKAIIFAIWKSKYFTRTREKLVSHMAIIHRRSSTMRKVIYGWRGVLGSTWKSNIEKKIKSEAEVCIQEISQKYIDQISMLNDQLTQANLKLKQAESKTDLKEAEMKRALMRGVCALNMEAMSVFRDKNMLADPSTSVVTKEALQNIADPSFKAVVIPLNTQKPLQFAEKGYNKMAGVLVTRHQ